MTPQGDRRRHVEALRVIALVSAFNEADILGHVLEHLIDQRIEVYLIDDGSSDGTPAVAARYLHRGLLKIERRPPVERFAWGEILRRKEELAAELEADWFMHHDADEFRESPWLDVDLRAAIGHVDRAGYNAIDFRVLNFRPTDTALPAGGDPRRMLHRYEPAEDWDRLQIKCWRKGPHRIDLVSSGGHDAMFPDRRVCPLQFILRHYPIRSEAQGRRKIDIERLPRFNPDETARGWHVQYRALSEARSLIWDPATLIEYDPVEVRRELVLRPRESEELECQRANTRRLEQEIQAVREEAARSQQDAADAVEAQRQETQQARAEAQHAQVQAEHARAEAQRANVEAEHARAEAQRANVEAECATRQVGDLLASKSWRVTRPLRWAYGLIGPTRAVLDTDAPVTRSGASRSLNWGDLARNTPVSQHWGFDRGLPVDRYYIQRFLEACRSDVRGRVLEVKDAGYTTAIGSSAVTDSQVIDVNPANAHATMVADLAAADHLPGNQFDCFILTQTIHIVYDCRAALRHAARLLKPGGVLLCTIPAVSRVSDEDGGLESGDYWRMTHAAVRRLFDDVFDWGNVDVRTYGNVRTCAAFLYGLAAEELPQGDLDRHDPWFPLIHCVRAIRHP